MADQGNLQQVMEVCDEGLRAEVAGDVARAAQLYQQAWEVAEGPVARCVGAHYLARQQPTETEALHWNVMALTIAGEVDDVEDIRELLPVLYLNAASGALRVGEFEQARDLYLQAAELIGFDEAGGVSAEWASIFLGLQAAGFVPQGDSPELQQLLANLESSRHRAALAMILPRYVTNTGSDADVDALIEALEAVLVARMVSAEDSELLRAAIDSARAQLAGTAMPTEQPRGAAVPAEQGAPHSGATATAAAAPADGPRPADPGTDLDVAFRL